MSRPYFQFPLCALSFGTSIDERLNHIISFCCVERGRRRWQTLSQEERRRYRSAAESPFRSVPGIHVSVYAEVQAALGAEHLNVKIGSVTAILESHERLAVFISSFEKLHGKDARVRIVTNWLFEARDKTGISYRELAVLIAIYSKIGSKKTAVRITQAEIWRRAHGFRSKAVYRIYMLVLKEFLTTWQTRSTIENLHGRKFFARVTFGRRETYYSHRLSAAQLADSVFKKKTLQSAAAHARHEAGATLTAKIKKELQRLTLKSAPPP